MPRHNGQDTATVWVETDGPCEVEVSGHRARTCRVAGHCYALVVVDGLRPDLSHPYAVRLDGVQCWPEPGLAYPQRVTAPSRSTACRAMRILRRAALAEQLRAWSAQQWPELLLLFGDQVRR